MEPALTFLTARQVTDEADELPLPCLRDLAYCQLHPNAYRGTIMSELTPGFPVRWF